MHQDSVKWRLERYLRRLLQSSSFPNMLAKKYTFWDLFPIGRAPTIVPKVNFFGKKGSRNLPAVLPGAVQGTDVLCRRRRK